MRRIFSMNLSLRLRPLSDFFFLQRHIARPCSYPAASCDFENPLAAMQHEDRSDQGPRLACVSVPKKSSLD